MVAVVKETQRTASAGGIVDYFGHDRVVLAKVKFVANSDFTGRVNEYVPQAQFLVQFAQQEHFDACACFFLVTVKACGKYLGVVKHKHVVFIEKGQDVLEHQVFDFARFSVQHEHSALIAVGSRIFCNLFLGELEFEL